MDILKRIEELQTIHAEADRVAAEAGRAVHAAQLELVYEIVHQIDAVIKAHCPEAIAVVVPTEWTASSEFYFPHWIEIRGYPTELGWSGVLDYLLPQFSSDHYTLRPGRE